MFRQNSTKGYQLVEDDFTSAIVRDYPDKYSAGLVLAWFVELLRQESALTGLPIEIELIAAEYVSIYPCIGVHYLEPELDDVAPLILSLLAQYSDRYSFGEFHRFLLTHRETASVLRQKFEQA
jgi:hypothetical protein